MATSILSFRRSMPSGSAGELQRAIDRFLNGFGELRALQARITETCEGEVLGPAKDMAGLYAIIEGTTGHRDTSIRPSLKKSHEAFTAMLVAANSDYLLLHPRRRIGRRGAATPTPLRRPSQSWPTLPTTTCSAWHCSI